MGKSKRRGKSPETPRVENIAYGLDAGAYSPNREFNMFPCVQRKNITACRRTRIISQSRDLYYNSPEVRHAVKTLSMLVGTLKPLAKSSDVEWNKLAERAFARRTSDPANFELTNTLDFGQLQQYVEEQAVVDGDCLVVMLKGGRVAVYPADMLANKTDDKDCVDGVHTDSVGRAVYYNIHGKDKDVRVKASDCMLYRHSSDPTDPRGLTDLVAAITTAQDLYEINGYNKQSVKLSASLGIIETVDNNVRRTDVSDLNMMRNGGSMGTSTSPQHEPSQNLSPLSIDGVRALTLSPGHDLKTIADNRPSNEVRNFARDMVDAIAHSVGLDAEILYRVKELGSASVRLIIAKCKDWARPRINDKRRLCQRIWQHVIADEIASGRLRPCKDMDTMWDCQWVGNSQWSIDLGRDASTAISLIREGLMSKQDYALEYFGKSYEEIAHDNATAAAMLLAECESAGVPIQVVAPGQVGSMPLEVVVDNGTSES